MNVSSSVLKLNHCDKIDAVEIDMKFDLFHSDWLWRIADGNRAGPYNLRPIVFIASPVAVAFLPRVFFL